jgi:hypothetical protein
MKDLGPYPSGGTITMVNYANFNKKCVDSSLTMFMQYSPFLLLMEVTPTSVWSMSLYPVTNAYEIIYFNPQ